MTLPYGFTDLAELKHERVSTVGVDVVWDAVQASVQEWNRVVAQLLETLAWRTTAFKMREMMPGGAEYQTLDEYGAPLITKSRGYYDLAFPLQAAGYAFGLTERSWAYMTVEEFARLTSDGLRADAAWLRRLMLAAIFTGSSWTFNDPLYGSLTIQPLANGDSTEYVFRGDVSTATDDHYLAQSAAISDTDDPFPTIYEELAEHVGVDGPYVAYIPTNLKTAIMSLTSFSEVKDPDLVPSVNNDFVRPGTVSAIPTFSGRVLGKSSEVWIVNWPSLPDNYIFAAALNASPKLLAWREHEPPELRGLRTVQVENLKNGLYEVLFKRDAGFGVRNRVAALMYQIGAASYSAPSGWTAPIR